MEIFYKQPELFLFSLLASIKLESNMVIQDINKIPMKLLIRYHYFLKQISTGWFIPLVTVLTFMVVLPFIPLFYLLDKIEGSISGPISIDFLPFFMKVLSLSVITPIVETFVFQWIPIRFLRYHFNWSSFKIILVSAILFGLSHYYSLAYIIRGFLIGIILADAFILQEEKQGSPFWAVTAIHGLRNAISMVLFY